MLFWSQAFYNYQFAKSGRKMFLENEKKRETNFDWSANGAYKNAGNCKTGNVVVKLL